MAVNNKAPNAKVTAIQKGNKAVPKTIKPKPNSVKPKISSKISSKISMIKPKTDVAKTKPTNKLKTLTARSKALRAKLKPNMNGGSRTRSKSRSRAKAKPKMPSAKNIDLKSCIPPLGQMGTDKNKNIIIPSAGKEPVCYASEQGKRDSMEDTYQIMHFTIGNKRGTFYGVFDGHGGKDVSFQIVSTSGGLFPYLRNGLAKYPNMDISQVLKLSFVEYDRKLFDMKLKSGSTAIVVLHYNDHLYMINLGDSRAMIFTDNGFIKISQDHKPWKSTERSRIYKAGHFVNPFKIYTDKTKKSYDYGDVYSNPKTSEYQLYLNGGWEDISKEQFSQIKSLNSEVDTHRVCNSLALSRAFGDFYLKVDKVGGKYLGVEAAISPEPDITVIPLRPLKGKRVNIFLASDGFWDVSKVTPNFTSMLSTNPNPMGMCQQLVDEAISKGSTDNTTVVFDRFVVV